MKKPEIYPSQPDEITWGSNPDGLQGAAIVLESRAIEDLSVLISYI